MIHNQAICDSVRCARSRVAQDREPSPHQTQPIARHDWGINVRAFAHRSWVAHDRGADGGGADSGMLMVLGAEGGMLII